MRVQLPFKPTHIGNVFSPYSMLTSFSNIGELQNRKSNGGLWQSRNARIWENKLEDAASIVWAGQSLLEDWKQARCLNVQLDGEDSATTTISGEATWTAPRAGFVKCNVDAAFSLTSNKVGVGMCLRDAGGNFISAKTNRDAPISAGPPSLNAWVLDGGSLGNNRKNSTKGTLNEHRLEPIEEIASSSLASLSINKNENSDISSVDESSNFNAPSATYSVPIPSAPLLPDNAAWFTDVQTSLPAPKFPESLSPIGGYSDWSFTHGPPGYDPRFPVFFNGYPPPGQMTSSEWLRWYRENHKPERANNYMQPTYLNTAGPGNHENFPYHDNTHRFDQFDRWGSPLSFNNQYTYIESPGPPPLQPGFIGASEHKASLFNNFQKPGSFGYGAATELRNEPQSLLECLKEKEWRLQRDLNLRGPTFTGNYNSSQH